MERFKPPKKKSLSMLYFIIECCSFFGIFFLVDWVFGNGSRFLHLSPHPFWIFISIISLQYGSSEGIAATILSFAMLYTNNLPEHLPSQDFYDYLFKIFLFPILWLLTAIVVGEMRCKQRQEVKSLADDLERVVFNLDTLSQAYSQVCKQKNHYEITLASQLNSPLILHQKLKALQQSKDPWPIVDEILQILLPMKSFSFFKKEGKNFVLFYCKGWEDEEYAKTFKDKHLLSETLLKSKKKSLFAMISQEDAHVLDGEGEAVFPLMNKSEKVVGFFKIEACDRESCNLSMRKTLEIFSDLLTSYTNKLFSRNFIQVRQENDLRDLQTPMDRPNLLKQNKKNLPTYKKHKRSTKEAKDKSNP